MPKLPITAMVAAVIVGPCTMAAGSGKYAGSVKFMLGVPLMEAAREALAVDDGVQEFVNVTVVDMELDCVTVTDTVLDTETVTLLV